MAVDSIKQIVVKYQASLTGEKLEKFQLLSEVEQIALAISNTPNAAKTDTGALSNLETKPTKGPVKDVFPADRGSVDNSAGIFLERKGAPYVDEATGKPSVEAKVEKDKTEAQSTPEKTTKYTVQFGESIDGLVRKSLKAKGIENPDAKTLEDATKEFEETNKSIIKHSTRKNTDFLIAGKKAVLEGEVSTEGLKTTKQINDEWAEKYPKKHVEAPAAKEAKDKKAVVKPQVQIETAAKPSVAKASQSTPPAKEKSYIVTPSAAEIKDLYSEKGGHFIKNTKTGLISQIYNVGSERTVVTYDKNKKSIQRDVYASDHSKRTLTHPDGNGFYTQLCETDTKGKKTYKVWQDGLWQLGAAPKAKAPIQAPPKTQAAQQTGDTKKAKEKSYIVTPSAEETKDIQSKKGGHFIKNTKTGLISQIYTDSKENVRAVNTYKKDGNGGQKDLYRADDVETRIYNEDGKTVMAIHHYKDKTVKTFKGNDGHGHFSSLSVIEPDKTKKYYTASDANGTWHKNVIAKPDGTKTHFTLKDNKWIEDKKASKAKSEGVTTESTLDVDRKTTINKDVTKKDKDGYFFKTYNNPKTGLPVTEKYDIYKRLVLKTTHKKGSTINEFYDSKGKNTKRETYYADGIQKIQEERDGLGHFAKVTLVDSTQKTVYTLFDRNQKPTKKTVLKDGVKESYKRDENGKWMLD